MTEQQYKDSIALYHPSGGHRTGKIYNIRNTDGVTPTNDLTVTGGGGTRINAAGLVENIIYNGIANSSNIKASTSGGTETYNASTAPDGSTTATKWTVRDGYTYVGGRWLSSERNSSSDSENCSVFAKAGTATTLDMGDNSNNVVRFDILNGTVLQNGTSAVGTITSEGNGWYRCSINYRVNTALYLISGGNVVGDTLFLWGFQSTIREGNTLMPLQITGSAAFPKIDYSTGKAAFLIEPSRTNHVTNSYTFSDWLKRNASTTITVDQVGITGEPNKASLLGDSGVDDYAEIDLRADVSAIIKSSIWVKKDSDETRFPEFYIRHRKSSDNLYLETLVQLNTATGATAIRANINTLPFQVIDRVGWWELVFKSSESSNRYTMSIRPAITTTIGNFEGNTVGSIVLGHVGLYNSNVVNETPIITNGALVTRTLNRYEVNIKPPQKGSILIDFESPLKSDGNLKHFWDFHNPSNYDPDRLVFVLHTVQDKFRVHAQTSVGTSISMTTNTVYDNQRARVLFNYDNDTGAKIFYNGVEIYSTTSTNFLSPDLSRLTLGHWGRSISHPEYHGQPSINDFKIGTYLTDQEAIDLTTL
jgi:hypothetical protein